MKQSYIRGLLRLQLIIASVLYAGAVMADTFDYAGITYETTVAGEATAIYYDDSLGAAVTIPPQVSYKKDEEEITVKVTGIEASVFEGKAVNSVTLPSTIKTLPANLFKRCDKLEAVNPPEDIMELPENIFNECRLLKSIKIPSKVVTLRNSVFSNCTSLTSVTLPAGLSSIESYAFYECKSLKSLDIPASVKTIGECIIKECSSLQSVNISAQITTLSDRFFEGCTSLQTVALPAGLKTIGNNLFSGLKSLTSVNIPENVVSVGSAAFAYCTSLTSINIPENVESVGDYAFAGCTSLRTVVLPAGLKTIGNSFFSGCESLTSVNIPENVVSVGNSAFAGCAAMKEIDLPDGVKTLGDYCFSRSGLTSFIFPNSLESIGENCFCAAEKIQEMTINAGFKSFGDGAFDVKDSFYIQKVVFKGSLEDWFNIEFDGDNYPEGTSPMSIAKEFYYNKGGSSVLLEGVLEIPVSVTEIKPYAFYRYKKINGLKFSGKKLIIPMFALIPQWIKNIVYTGTTESWLTGIFDGIPYGPGVSLNLGGGEFDGNISIPRGITRIPKGRLAYPEVRNINNENDVVVICDEGFYGSGLRTASFLEHVDSIGEGAFEATQLTEAKLSPNLGAIPDRAFASCPNLQSVSIASGTRSTSTMKGIAIGARAFLNDANLKTLDLPPFTSVGTDAFKGTGIFTSQPDGLVYINNCLFGFKGTGAVPSSLEIKPGTLSVAADAFSTYDEPSITKLTIPNGVITIGNSAFEGQGMASLNVPGSVSYIGDFAFARCGNLSSVTLNEGLEYFGNCFESTTSLKSLTLPASVKDAYLPSKETLIIKDSPEPLNYFGNRSIVEIAVKDRLYIGRNLKPVIKDSRFDYILRVNVDAPDQSGMARSASTAIEFGEKVSEIGGMLEFSGYPTDKVICYSSTAPSLGEVYFMNGAYEKSVLTVPTGAVESYRTQYPWSQFANIAEGAVSSVGSIYVADAISVKRSGNIITLTGVEDGEHVKIYAASGCLIAKGVAPTLEIQANAGMYIIRVAGKSLKVML